MAKILIVGPAHPLRGGLATYNERLADAFIEKGHTCDILSFSLQYPSILFPGKSQFSNEPLSKPVQIFPIINSVNPFNWLTVGHQMAAKQYDIVIFRYWMSFMAPCFGTIARIIKQQSQATILAIVDNLIPHERTIIDQVITPYFIESCQGFLTMSEAVKQQLENWPVNKPICYTPHPMYDMFGPIASKAEAKQKIGLDTNTNYLLFFGFIRAYKGLNILLDSLSLIDMDRLNLKIIIAGEFYENAEPYFEKIKALYLQDRLVMRNDFIPNSDVANYFNAADAVIQPYTSATQSGVTQIAYYYNKPMIVTNVGGLAELVPHGKSGLVCNPNAEALAANIVKLYEEELIDKLTQGACEEKQRFTWDTLIQKLFELVKL